jgi:hypothetical protein
MRIAHGLDDAATICGRAERSTCRAVVTSANCCAAAHRQDRDFAAARVPRLARRAAGRRQARGAAMFG